MKRHISRPIRIDYYPKTKEGIEKIDKLEEEAKEAIEDLDESRWDKGTIGPNEEKSASGAEKTGEELPDQGLLAYNDLAVDREAMEKFIEEIMGED